MGSWADFLAGARWCLFHLLQGYEEYVGSKTTMRFLNEAMTYRYKNSIVWAMRDSFQSCLQDFYNRAMRGVRRFGGSRQRFQVIGGRPLCNSTVLTAPPPASPLPEARVIVPWNPWIGKSLA